MVVNLNKITGPGAVTPLALKLQDAAFMVGVSVPTMRRLVSEGQIKPCGRVLRHILISRAELERWVSGVEL